MTLILPCGGTVEVDHLSGGRRHFCTCGCKASYAIFAKRHPVSYDVELLNTPDDAA